MSQFALTLGPVLLGMQFGSAAGHLARRAFGQYALPLPWPESNTLVLVPANVAQFAEDWSLPLQEVQLWVCVRELTMHAVITRPGVRASLLRLLGDAAAHAAASQRSFVDQLGDGLGDPNMLENVLQDPESLLADLVSPEQRNISNTLTALTTAIGAYVDHVTTGIAASLTSSSAALNEAWYRYRVEDAKGEQAFAGLFGLDVGQAEVDRGAAFISGVVERAGEARCWPVYGPTKWTSRPRPRSMRPGSGWLASACSTDGRAPERRPKRPPVNDLFDGVLGEAEVPLQRQVLPLGVTHAPARGCGGTADRVAGAAPTGPVPVPGTSR